MRFARAPDGLGAKVVERNDEIDPNRDRRKASPRRDQNLLVLRSNASRTFLQLVRQGPATRASRLLHVFRTPSEAKRERSCAGERLLRTQQKIASRSQRPRGKSGARVESR